MSYFVIIEGLLYSCDNYYFFPSWFADRNVEEKLTQVKIPNCKFASVSRGAMHAMAIDEGGYLWSCGDNYYGQLGIIDERGGDVWTKVSAIKKFQAVACGDYFTAAIDSEGYLWVCGNGGCGQLGLFPERQNVVNETAGSKIIRCILYILGIPFCFVFPELNTDEEKTLLVKFSDKKFMTVCCSGDHMIVIDVNGYLWGYGSNRFGQLGLGSCEKVDVLTKISEQQFVAVSSCQHTVAIDINGHLWSCGKNEAGGMCLGGDVLVLSKVSNLEKKFLAVTCNYCSTMLVDNKKRLWCCGRNNTGRLGLGHSNNVPLCKNNFFTNKVIYATLLYNYAFVIDEDGSIWVSGHDAFGPFNNQKSHIFNKVHLDKPVDILMNCSPRKIGPRTKGAHGQ